MSEQLAGGLTAFEVMWPDHYKLIASDSGHHEAPILPDYAYYIIVEHQGASPQRGSDLFSAAFEMAFEKDILVDAVLAQSETQACTLSENLFLELLIMAPSTIDVETSANSGRFEPNFRLFNLLRREYLKLAYPVSITVPKGKLICIVNTKQSITKILGNQTLL